MKNSTLLLGMAVLVFNLTTAANTSKIIKSTQDNEQDFFLIEKNPLEKRNAVPVEDQVILNPATVIAVSYQKSLEEVIAENNQIIESNITDEGVRYFTETPIEDIIQQNNLIIESNYTLEVHPLYIERTIEDQIAEDNSIIESEIANVSMPLDFEVINKKLFSLKQSYNKWLGMN